MRNDFQGVHTGEVSLRSHTVMVFTQERMSILP